MTIPGNRTRVVSVFAWLSAIRHISTSRVQLTVRSRNCKRFIPLRMVTCMSGTVSIARFELPAVSVAVGCRSSRARRNKADSI
jgi:hypothetical protein